MYGERKLITHCSSEIDIAVPGSCHASSLWIDPPTMLIWYQQIVTVTVSPLRKADQQKISHNLFRSVQLWNCNLSLNSKTVLTSGAVPCG